MLGMEIFASIAGLILVLLPLLRRSRMDLSQKN